MKKALKLPVTPIEDAEIEILADQIGTSKAGLLRSGWRLLQAVVKGNKLYSDDLLDIEIEVKNARRNKRNA